MNREGKGDYPRRTKGAPGMTSELHPRLGGLCADAGVVGAGRGQGGGRPGAFPCFSALTSCLLLLTYVQIGLGHVQQNRWETFCYHQQRHIQPQHGVRGSSRAAQHPGKSSPLGNAVRWEDLRISRESLACPTHL